MRTLYVALVALVLSACSGAPVAPSKSAEPQPLEVELKRYPGGEPYLLSSDRGSVVLVDVWATWCEPCRESLPIYTRLARKYAAQGLKVYALSVDEEPQQIGPFLEETRVELPVLLDPEGHVATTRLGLRMVPTSLLIDRRGVVRHVHEGFDDGLVARYTAEIEALLAESTP
jgi:cytochrome c biogenesis protein CcmG, thiol:disulfide interchange protein DsbE